MKIATSGQMRELDNRAIVALGIPSTLLMTNAARQVALAAMAYTAENPSAAVFCGSGNNGGDGIAAAAFLKKQGLIVRVFLVGDRGKMTEDAREMVRRLEEIGGVLEDFDPELAGLSDFCKQAGVIIDAIFGIGLGAALRGQAMEAVALINSAVAPVVSADIASGVEADTGRVLGDAVRPDVTVTFTFPKPGNVTCTGGRLEIADIGIPVCLQEALLTDTHLVTETDIALPRRRRDGHKGDFGKLLLVCGSVGYTGAPALCAGAAVRSGAGLVFLGVPEAIYHVTAVKCDEAMPFPLPSDEAGRLTLDALPWLLSKLAECDACVLGPGLGRSPQVAELVYELIRQSKIPLILDADGINAVSENIHILDEATCPLILTPHTGEFCRLGGNPENRLEAARQFAVSHGCTLVLKGRGTVTAFRDSTAYVNTTGNSGMAKGGSGDVLSGMIAALIGQGIPLERAVYTAVWLHGRAGDVAACARGEYAATPSDFIAALPEVFQNTAYT